jgi:uncharacterized phage-associated protein
MSNPRADAKEVICLLVGAAGGALRGKVRLNKAFYFAHLYYWREAGGVLTSHPIVRMPHGPGIDDAQRLIAELVEEGLLSVATSQNGPFDENVYRLTGEPSPIDESTAKGRAISQAIAFVEGRTAAELSEITHEHSPTWRTTPDGGEMNIYLDLMDEEEIQSIRDRLAEIRKREGPLWPPAF